MKIQNCLYAGSEIHHKENSRYLCVFEDYRQVSRALAFLGPYGFVCSELKELQHCLLSAILHGYRQSLTKNISPTHHVQSQI